MKFVWMLMVASAAFAQLPISVGVKAGYVSNSRGNSEILPFKGGPFLELNLPVIPTIETGLMLERYSINGNGSTVYQVPVLLKKRVNSLAIKPFASAGITFRRVPEYDHSTAGLTVAGGLTLSVLPIKIEPELRYTKWFSAAHSPRSFQTEFLIGFRF